MTTATSGRIGQPGPRRPARLLSRLARPLAALGLLLATAGAAQAQTTTYAYTSAAQTYVVPVGVTQLRVTAIGAGGGAGYQQTNASYGAQVQATVAVTPNEILTIQVGGQGSVGSLALSGNAGGYNGGGTGYAGGGGGGATDLRRAAPRTDDYLAARNALVVAGGGGGGSRSGPVGGSGGVPNGSAGAGNPSSQGATQSQPGGNTAGGQAGTTSTGGAGDTPSVYGSGGGGGYYGGGGSGGSSGGGGGSSFVTSTGISISYSVAITAGDGALVITPVQPAGTTAVAFAFAGAATQTYVVPTGVTTLQVVATGAGGGQGYSSSSNAGGYGAQVQATVPVTPGEVLTVVVGGRVAGIATGSNAGGFNGGGSSNGGGGGGGATDLRRMYSASANTGDYLASRNALVVAGGGGGGESYSTRTSGGGNGGIPAGSSGMGQSTGQGATQQAAGTNGGGGSTSGNMNIGGNGDGYFHGGGGGGGYYGGGGGEGSGGGGSSFVTSAGTNVSYSVAPTADNGALVLTPLYAPTLTSLSPGSGPIGATITLTGTNMAGATAVSFNGTAATFSVINASTLTATVPAGATTGLVTVTTPGGTTGGQLFTVVTDLVVSTPGQSIVGGTYNTITVLSGGTGTLAGNVSVTTSTSVSDGGTLNDGCFVLSGPGSFTLAAGGTLGICAQAGISSSGATGAIQTTGGRSFSTDASYVYNATALQNTGTGLPTQVRNLTTTAPAGQPLFLSARTSVAQVLTVGAADLVLNGNALTLLSSASGTALVVNSGAGTVQGTVTVQRSIDPTLNPGAGYRHYSAPVSNTTLADLATSGYSPEISQATTYNGSATPGTTTPFPTLFAYDQSRLASVTNNYSAFDKGFVVPTTLTAAMSVGKGYVAQIGAAQLVDFVGTATSGDQTTLTFPRNAVGTAGDGAAGWQLVGNPYPAPLDYSLVAPADRQNLDAAMYVVQSTGQYAGGYRTYVNGQSTTATNNPLIASSQGFWVRVSAGQTSGSLTFRNAQRVTTYTSQAAFQRSTPDPRPALRLALTGAGLADAWVAYAEAGATPAFDGQYDAGKLPNSTGLNLSSVAGAENLAIDGRAAFAAATVLPLAVGVPAAGTYTLTAEALSNLPAGLDAYLLDAQTGQTVRLSVGTSYPFSVSTTQAQALVLGRFSLVFRPSSALAAAPSLLAESVSVYPNPAHGRFVVAVPAVAGASQVQAELLNALGQVVRRQSAPLPAAGALLPVATDGLAEGVYTLRLTAGSSTLAKRVVIR
ncbi:MAG: glycine-rich protein [Janthinobacterium lividum]